jgi:hypothetical protein
LTALVAIVVGLTDENVGAAENLGRGEGVGRNQELGHSLRMADVMLRGGRVD